LQIGRTFSFINENVKAKIDVAEAWRKFYEVETIIELSFGSMMQRKLKCSNCNNIVTNYDPYLDFSLPININKLYLSNCVDNLFKSEILNGKKINYKCDNCNQ